MAVTKSWAAPGARPAVVAIKTQRARRGEWLWLTAASFFVASGLAMVFAAVESAGTGRRVKIRI